MANLLWMVSTRQRYILRPTLVEGGTKTRTGLVLKQGLDWYWTLRAVKFKVSHGNKAGEL